MAAYETKVILTLLAHQVAMSKSIEEAYAAIRRAANVEGLQLPPLDEFLREIEQETRKD